MPRAANLEVLPLTPALWPALEDLFLDGGPTRRCWCMYWRIGAGYRRRPDAENRDNFRAIVRHGPPPGLIALKDDLSVGWAQVTPRADLAWLDRAWRFAPVGETSVWALSCFYIRKGFRRQGVTSALIGAAAQMARNAGAPALEAYPLDADLTPSASGTGYVSTFLRAGFKVVARRAPPRPVMRLDLNAGEATGPAAAR